MKSNMDNVKKISCFTRRNGKEERVEVDSSELLWRPSIYGILIEDNKILLSKQWDGYDFPGGGADIHETVEETLEREFWEETGVKIKTGSAIHCETSFFIPKYCDESWNCVLVYFLCEKIGGELSMENFDENEKEYSGMPEWISLDDIDKIKFYNGIDSPKLIRKVAGKITN